MSMTTPRIYAALLGLLLIGADSAHADQSSATAQSPPSSLSWTYLIDGGAIPFFYVPLVASAVLEFGVETAMTPLVFDPGEGGAEIKGDTIPNAAVGVVVGLGLGALIATPADARWYHVKGFAEATATTLLATTAVKHAFGRHRPDFDPDAPDADEDSRQSFFSGHSSLTLVTTTYLGAYLHQHVFSRWRAPGDSVAWWETIPYAGLTALSIYVPVSRVLDNRHHPSDVAVGALVGASCAVAFYLWQEHRYRSDSRAVELTLAPNLDNPGLVLAGRF